MDVLASPGLEESAKMLNEQDTPNGDLGYRLGAAFLFPYPNRIRGKLSADGKTLSTEWKGHDHHPPRQQHRNQARRRAPRHARPHPQVQGRGPQSSANPRRRLLSPALFAAVISTATGSPSLTSSSRSLSPLKTSTFPSAPTTSATSPNPSPSPGTHTSTYPAEIAPRPASMYPPAPWPRSTTTTTSSPPAKSSP